MYHDANGPSMDVEYQFRASERLTICLDAALARTPLPDIPIRLRDVSSMGFMAEVEEFVSIGSIVDLKLPGLDPMPSEIRWVLSGWIGCKFEEELGWDKLFRLLVVTEPAAAAEDASLRSDRRAGGAN